MFRLMRTLLPAKTLCPNSACAHFGRPVRSREHRGPDLCGRCQQPLPSSHEGEPPAVVMVLGSPNCGKTTWLLRGLQALAGEHEGLRFALASQQDSWEQQTTALDCGRPAASTPAVPGVAWCCDVALEGQWRRLHVHEVGGEASADEATLFRYRAFQRVTGLVLVLDPFAIPALRHRHGAVARSMRPPLRPAPEPYDASHVTALLRVLDRYRAPTEGHRWTIPVALVLTKLDAMGLSLEFGDPRTPNADDVETACRRKLLAWDFDRLLRSLEAHFRPVRCFATDPYAGGAFSPERPILWMLEQASLGRGG